jgi:ribosomal protein S4
MMLKAKKLNTLMVFRKTVTEVYLKSISYQGVTGESSFLQLCEARLDNGFFRMGVAPSREQRTTCFSLNTHYCGEVVNIHVTCKPGDKVAVRENLSH